MIKSIFSHKTIYCSFFAIVGAFVFLGIHTAHAAPSQISGEIISVKSGWNFTCILTDQAEVYCWGDGRDGQLGNDDTQIIYTSVQVHDGQATGADTDGTYLANVRQLDVGLSHACALTYSDQMYCWGDNSYSQLGGASSGYSDTPVRVYDGEAVGADTDGTYLANILSMFVGDNHTCVVTNSDAMYCWGSGTYGQLGNDSSSNRSTPVRVRDGVASGADTDGTYLTNIDLITAGGVHTCAYTNSGALYCWGYNSNGQLGNDSIVNRDTPVRVYDGEAVGADTDGTYLTNVSAISNGNENMCATTNAGNVYCWGRGLQGRLGNDAVTDSHVPARVHDGEAIGVDNSGSYLSGVKSLSVSGAHICSVTNNDNVYCWGYGSSGRLGNDASSNSSIPVRVHDGEAVGVDSDGTYLVNIEMVSAGNGHNCALSFEGNVYCWGTGNLGIGNGTGSDVPVFSAQSNVVVAQSTVTLLSASSITETSAIGNGNVSNTGGENPTREIEWGTTSGGPYTSSCSAGTGGVGAYSCSMTSLTENTTYYVRAKATNSAGTSYGTETSFTTLASGLGDIIIPYPDATKINTRTGEGYMSVKTGTINIAEVVETNVNVTLRTSESDVIFPKNTIITKQGGGTFNFAQFTNETVTDSVRIEQPDTRVAVKIGTNTEGFSFSQDVTITANVGEAFNGQELDILYQNTGESTWNSHTTCTVSEGNCTFTTDHATIYTINGSLQSTGDAPININTEVQDTLTLDCHDTQGTTGDYTVTLGTTTDPGKVTPGSPATGQSTCTVTTNDDQGYYLTLIDDNAATNTVLTHTDPHTGSIYEIQDLTQFPATTTWTTPTTKGLGFSVISFPDGDMTNNQFDGTWTETGTCPEGNNPDTNTYAGIPDTAETISAVTQYESLSTTTNICYKVDVPASQASGQYTGSVTYTATSDASSYLN